MAVAERCGMILTETTGLTLSFHEGEHIVLLAWALHIAHDRAVVVRGAGLGHQAHAHLGHVAARAGAAQNLDDQANLSLVCTLRDDLLGLLVVLLRISHDTLRCSLCMCMCMHVCV
ncbi:40S ribosomal protein S33, putative [Leishmania tarentolae]|uniref:40S ribosomal protein S33, putative n=1 Tax=Leishmania tarentolae TaxID=5689 RepID=A0A640KKE7_LEITA|nr:40S ribosomal protein S33, putative [Leishmania tarentolae]